MKSTVLDAENNIVTRICVLPLPSGATVWQRKTPVSSQFLIEQCGIKQ